jgi:hypothetical protein
MQPSDIEEYQDPVLKKYIELIKSATNVFKAVYYGDPIRIPQSSLPALIVSKLDTRVTKLTNVEDEHEIHISFTIVANIRDTISEDKTMAAGTNSLYNMMEGRNANYTLKDDALLNILRHTIDIDTAYNLRTDLKTITSVDYGMTVGKRGPDSYAMEAVVSIVAHYNQLR